MNAFLISYLVVAVVVAGLVIAVYADDKDKPTLDIWTVGLMGAFWPIVLMAGVWMTIFAADKRRREKRKTPS